MDSQTTNTMQEADKSIFSSFLNIFSTPEFFQGLFLCIQALLTVKILSLKKQPPLRRKLRS